MAGTEGAGRARVAVLRLWAATSQTPDLAVCAVDHLDELPHPGAGDETTLRTREAPRSSKHSCKSVGDRDSLEHEEQVWVPLQEAGVELLGGLDGLAHPA